MAANCQRCNKPFDWNPTGRRKYCKTCLPIVQKKQKQEYYLAHRDEYKLKRCL